MGTLTSKCLDVMRLAAGGKESNIKYCGTYLCQQVPPLLSYKTSVRMGLVKVINQIRTKIVEGDNNHHFWSIAFQCPIQDLATTLIPDQEVGI